MRMQIVRVLVVVLVLFVLIVGGSVEAHGQRGPNHVHFEGYGRSSACINLRSNPLGYYKIYSIWPSAYYRNSDGSWHIHYPYSWDNKGHIVGGGRIGQTFVCGTGA